MKTDWYVVKVKDNDKEYLYPCDEIGSSVFTYNEAVKQIKDLENKKGAIIYPDNCTFSLMKKIDANKLFSYIERQIK